jgi:hypothetical protein
MKFGRTLSENAELEYTLWRSGSRTNPGRKWNSGSAVGGSWCAENEAEMADLTVSYAAAWIGICLGCAAGAVQGLFFHRETWLGGYNSWRRRMLRLGHISLAAIGLINLGLALTATALGIAASLVWPARLLIIGAITMPLFCYLSAFRDFFRHLFFIPALSVIAATAMIVWRVVTG